MQKSIAYEEKRGETKEDEHNSHQSHKLAHST
jgi:hypothetical protein